MWIEMNKNKGIIDAHEDEESLRDSHIKKSGRRWLILEAQLNNNPLYIMQCLLHRKWKRALVKIQTWMNKIDGRIFFIRKFFANFVDNWVDHLSKRRLRCVWR